MPQSVQLHPRSSPLITEATHDPVQDGVHGRHFAPLNGPRLEMAATGTPKCDGGKSSAYPPASSWGIRDSRERATTEVLKSPAPKRSFNPPYDEPEGTTYRPGIKCSGLRRPDQYPSTRVRIIQSLEDFDGGDSRSGAEKGELVGIGIQRTVKEEVGIRIHSENLLDNGGAGELEPPSSTYQANGDPGAVQLRRRISI
nr:hypothetical protein CRG98_033247 [Ipomoea batatas]